jgi:hypothetical protein
MDFLGLGNPFNGNKKSENDSKDSNNSKNHYFIGSVIDDDLLVEKLKLVRKNIIKKYKLKDLHYPNIFMNKVIYLGYFTKEVADLYMNKIVLYLLKSIGKDFSKLKCKFSNFNLNFDGKFYKASLETEDNNDILSKNIIPFLYEKGVKSVYGNRSYNKKCLLDILYFQPSEQFKKQKKRFGKEFKIIVNYPNDEFYINNLVLIKGTPVVTRAGTPSTHDNMDYEVVKDYSFTLEGNNSGINRPNNNINKKININNGNAKNGNNEKNNEQMNTNRQMNNRINNGQMNNRPNNGPMNNNRPMNNNGQMNNNRLNRNKANRQNNE